MTGVMRPPADRAMPKAGDVPDCPYKGLTPYTEGDAAYFFGRDRDRGLVVANLMASRLTLLYGPSGVGKSSLLQAGVLRQLHGMSGDGRAPSGMRPVIAAYHASWRDDPLVGLAAALRDALPEQLVDDFVPANSPLSVELLRRVTRQLNTKVVLVCDQFEEATVYQTGAPGDAFAAELGRIIAATDVRVAVLLGIREDALARLDRFEEDIPGLFDNLLRLDHLDLTAAREAIEQPVLRYNTEVPADRQVSVEPELVDELLPRLRTGCVSVVEAGRGDVERADVDDASATIETPFLQLVMTRLWSEEAARGSRTLRRSTLDELGGAEQIVRTHLDSVMSQLSDDQQEVAAHIFRYLVTRSGMKIAYTAEDLADCAGIDDRARVTDVLERLSAGRERVLRPVPPPVGQPGASQYEIFHDVMAPAVMDWRRRYVEARDRAESERALVQAKHEAERELVRQKEAADREAHDAHRRLNRSRRTSAVLATLAVACFTLAVVAVRTGNARNAAQSMTDSARLLQIDSRTSAAKALAAWRGGGSDPARELLRVALSHPLPSATLRGAAHSGAAWSAGMSPQEDHIVTSYNDGTARLWDARTGALLHVLNVGKGEVQANFSTEGSTVVAGAQDGRARVFNSRSGSLLSVLGQYAGFVFAKPGRVGTRDIVLTWANNENAIVWDARTGNMLARLTVPVRAASLSSDGTRVIVSAYGQLRVWSWMGKGTIIVDPARYPFTYDFFDPRFSSRNPSLVLAIDSYTGNLIEWEWNSGRPSRVLGQGQFGEAPESITESPSGELIAVAGGKNVRIYEAATGKLTGYLPKSDDYVITLAFSPDARYIARGDNDGTIRLFDVQNPNVGSSPLAVLAGHTGAVQTLAFSRNGRTLMSASADGLVRLWPLPDRVVLWRGTGPHGVVDARWSADGRIIVSGNFYEINVSDTQAPHLRRSFVWGGGPTQQLLGLALSPDNAYVVAAISEDTVPQVYDLRTGKERYTRYNGQTEWYLTKVDHSPQRAQPWIAVGNRGGGVEMLDVRTGRLRWSRQASSEQTPVYDVRFSADGSVVATADHDGTAKLFDAATGRLLHSFQHATPVSAVGLTTDARYLATYSEDRKIRIWSIGGSSDQPVSEVVLSARADSLAFSPDRRSRFLAVAASDGTTVVYAWHGPPTSIFAAMRQPLAPLATLQRHTGSVNAVAFEPTGGPKGKAPRLISAGDDGVLALYRCDLCAIPDDRLEQYAERQIARW